MNTCILIGRINSNIKFDFIISNNLNKTKEKNNSIVTFEIELNNKSKIKIKGYNNIADKCYRTLKTGQIVLIEGFLNEKHVYLENVKIIKNII